MCFLYVFANFIKYYIVYTLYGNIIHKNRKQFLTYKNKYNKDYMKM